MDSQDSHEQTVKGLDEGNRNVQNETESSEQHKQSAKQKPSDVRTTVDTQESSEQIVRGQTKVAGMCKMRLKAVNSKKKKVAEGPEWKLLIVVLMRLREWMILELMMQI